MKLKFAGKLFSALAIFLFTGSMVYADELVVVSSGGFAAALKQLAPQFEQQTGHHVKLEWGPSMGNTPQAIPQRLQRQEKIDVLVMVGTSLNQLVQQGQVEPSSAVRLASSRIALAVKAGKPRPDISTVTALKQALLNSRSIAFSDSASGVFLSTVLFERMGIANEIKGRSHMIPAEPVGNVVARGEADLGFQQLSELLPISGIDIVGLLPEEAQQVTDFSAGIVRNSPHENAARQLIRFLGSPRAEEVIKKTGMSPATTQHQ